MSRPPLDPCSVYPEVSGLPCPDYRLPTTEPMPPAHRRKALDELKAYETRQKANFLGYQANQKLDFAGELSEYLDFHVNNIGDPFVSGNFTVNSKVLERAVLDYYAKLWNAKLPSISQSDPNKPPKFTQDPESYWGYVLTMGSSEGNIYGLWNARDYLAGKFLLPDTDDRPAGDGKPHATETRLTYRQAPLPADNPNAFSPVCFYSQDTHYSIVKFMRVLAIDTFYAVGTARYPGQCPLPRSGGVWPQEVPSIDNEDGPGSIDTVALSSLVSFFADKGHPILLSLNYGTTFKGAYDDVEAAFAAIKPALQRNGLLERKVHYDPQRPDKFDIRTGYWIHVDGALGAAYMPFVEMAYDQGHMKQRGPNFDFRLPCVMSIVMSGHKWVGAPWPCGVYMTKVKYQLLPPDDPAYITGSPDTTFSGSRNGFSAIILWDYLARTSYAQEIKKALYTNGIAAYAEEQLRELEKRLKMDLWVKRSPLSLTVRFRGVKKALITKYSLSGEGYTVRGMDYVYNHVYAMESATRERIDQFIAELEHTPDAFPPNPTPHVAPQTVVATTPESPARVFVPLTGRGFR
ncbi:MAG: histidine decarboxylase [Candidatus Eremiobacteraeota bacterium]|nr:histidine decarboxylase [Candidatus Eremiobacteraeota bacterium]